METFKEKLECVINHTFEILRTNSSKSRIIFPKYRDEDKGQRVCEQELRFVFVEQLKELLDEYNLFYSVETPTQDKYIFTQNRQNVVPRNDENGQSANFDLTIVSKEGKSLKTIVIIEFKAKNANPHEYAKDLCKLWNPKEKSSYKYFLNLFEKIEKGTEESFKGKITPKTNNWIPNKTSSEQIIVMAQSLRENDPKIRIEI